MAQNTTNPHLQSDADRLYGRPSGVATIFDRLEGRELSSGERLFRAGLYTVIVVLLLVTAVLVVTSPVSGAS